MLLLAAKHISLLVHSDRMVYHSMEVSAVDNWMSSDNGGAESEQAESERNYDLPDAQSSLIDGEVQETADQPQGSAELLSSVVLPVKTNKRDRPNGAEKTVIALPRKKSRSGPTAFTALLMSERERKLLSWFVSAETN